MDYENDIKIDETSLDIELLEQPSLMFKYAKYRADLQLEVERAKETMDIVRAEMDNKIRSKPSAFNLEKVTDAAVASCILLQEEYQDAKDQYLALKHELDYAWAATNAIDARKGILENLVKLHGMQYFAGPRIPRDIKQERLQKQRQDQEINAGISSKIITRTKT